LLALGVAFVALAAGGVLAVVHLLRQNGRLLLKLDRIEQVLAEAGLSTAAEEPMPEIGLAPGTPAPDFAVKALDGAEATLGSLLEPGLPALLVFSSPTCGPCRALGPSVARWQRIHESVLTIAVASSGDEAEVRAEADERSLGRVLLDPEHALYSAYEANGTPSAVLIGADGKIASWMASGPEWVERLVGDALATAPAPEQGLPVGEPAPTVELATLDGDRTELTGAFRGESIVLFWNPQCGFCRQLHPDLIVWEAQRPAGSAELVVVSAGELDDVRAEGFGSTVLYDPEWTAMSAFSAGGTPTAVRVDADGRIASHLAVGADAVLGLLAAPASAR
jgi:thiol-disulfide isomerase/thioredoxin